MGVFFTYLLTGSFELMSIVTLIETVHELPLEFEVEFPIQLTSFHAVATVYTGFMVKLFQIFIYFIYGYWTNNNTLELDIISVFYLFICMFICLKLYYFKLLYAIEIMYIYEVIIPYLLKLFG